MEGYWTSTNGIESSYLGRSQSLFSWKGTGLVDVSGSIPSLPSQSLFSWKGTGPSESQWIGFWIQSGDMSQAPRDQLFRVQR